MGFDTRPPLIRFAAGLVVRKLPLQTKSRNFPIEIVCWRCLGLKKSLVSFVVGLMNEFICLTSVTYPF